MASSCIKPRGESSPCLSGAPQKVKDPDATVKETPYPTFGMQKGAAQTPISHTSDLSLLTRRSPESLPSTLSEHRGQQNRESGQDWGGEGGKCGKQGRSRASVLNVQGVLCTQTAGIKLHHEKDRSLISPLQQQSRLVN